MGKRFHVSYLSIASLVVSSISMLTFALILKVGGSYGLLRLVWIISGLSSLVLPIIAKYYRRKNGLNGRIIEIISLIIGFFGCDFVLVYFAKLSHNIDIIIVIALCAVYAKSFNGITTMEHTNTDGFTANDSDAANIAASLPANESVTNSVPIPEDKHHFKQEGKTTLPEENILICKKCGMKLQPESIFCHNCGKKVKKEQQKKSFAKQAAILVLILCIVVIGAFSVFLILNYQNGITAMDNQNFCAAERYFNKIPYSDRLFQDECAYIRAGVLMEQGKYFDALDAFNNLNIPVPSSVIQSLTQSIYVQAQENYRSGSFTKAKKGFTAVENYKQSNDYLFLIKCNRYPISDYFDDLLELIGFEDTDQIILNNSAYIKLFLKGEWRSINNIEYFKISKNGDASFNLPCYNGNTYLLNNGIYYTYGSDNLSGEAQFKFSIINRDTISVYCFKDESMHRLYRK